MKLLLTTLEGIEDVVVEEVGEKLAGAGMGATSVEAQPGGMRGVVVVESADSAEQLWSVLRSLRSVDHGIALKVQFSTDGAEPLSRVVEEVERAELPELAAAGSYRVTCRRKGAHQFSRMDVEREAGTVLGKKYGCPVDLESPEANVRIDVVEQRCLIGLQMNSTALSLPAWRIYRPRVSLKTSLAYAMLRLAELGSNEAGLLDPLCGSATIPILAAQQYPPMPIFGSDSHADGLTGARENARAAGLSDRVQLLRANAHELARTFPRASFSAIVTNPPFGIQLSRKRNFYWLYSSLLRAFRAVLEPDGRVVMLVWKYRILQTVLSEIRAFEVAHERRIVTGDTPLRLVVLRL